MDFDIPACDYQVIAEGLWWMKGKEIGDACYLPSEDPDLAVQPERSFSIPASVSLPVAATFGMVIFRVEVVETVIFPRRRRTV